MGFFLMISLFYILCVISSFVKYKMKVIAIITILGTLRYSTARSICDESRDSNRGYHVDFFDGFDTEALDTKSWKITVGNEIGQLRDSYGSEDSISITGGKLVIESKREKHGKYDFVSG